jgi:large subunit ribosomal protein L30
MKTIESSHLKVTQMRSSAGTSDVQRKIIKSLGLKGIGKSNILPNVNSILGQINKVIHLVAVEGSQPGELAK